MTKEERIINEAKRYYSGNIKCYDAFLHGAQWADNNPDLSLLWHDAAEAPKDDIDEYGCGNDCLMKTKFGYVEKGRALCVDGEYVFSCVTRVYQMDEIRCWAYISDLLPKHFVISEQPKGGEK